MGKRLRHQDHTEFADSIGAATRYESRDRSGIDDMSWLAMGDHVRDKRLQSVAYAVQIDAKHPVPVDIGNLPHRGGRSSIHNASVIEEQVNVAKPGGCFLIQRLDGALAHRIRDDPHHRDLALFEPARRALQR